MQSSWVDELFSELGTQCCHIQVPLDIANTSTGRKQLIKNNLTKQRNNTRCISNNAVHKKHKKQNCITLPKIVNPVAMASDESELEEISENSK